MTNMNSNSATQRVKQTAVYSVILLIVLYRFVSEGMLSQLARPFFISNETEFVYKLVNQLGLVDFFTQHTLAALSVDLLLFAIPIILIIHYNRLLAVMFSVVLVIYFLVFNSVAQHHYHGLAGALVASLVCCFAREHSFSLAWQGARNYLLYIFASAALWKIFRGALWTNGHFSSIMESQRLDYLLQHPDTFMSSILSFLIANHSVAQFFFTMTVITQLSFAAGFFTKRYDRLLLVVMLLFMLFNYFVMGIFSFELAILGLFLISEPYWEKVAVRHGKAIS